MVRNLFLLPLISIFAAGTQPLVAVDQPRDTVSTRLIGELMLGTSGFEPGIAAELRTVGLAHIIRPEIFLNEDFRPGFGISVAWNLTFLDLPDRQMISVGPRAVYHNSDNSGWEADAMAIWHMNMGSKQRSQHYLEVIGTLGALQDKDDDRRDTVIGASAGLAYGFQF